MCVCSVMTSDSNPRSSIARASDTVSMLLSLTNVEIPNFIAILNCWALLTTDVHQGQAIPGDTETTGTRAGLADLTGPTPRTGSQRGRVGFPRAKGGPVHGRDG